MTFWAYCAVASANAASDVVCIVCVCVYVWYACGKYLNFAIWDKIPEELLSKSSKCLQIIAHWHLVYTFLFFLLSFCFGFIPLYYICLSVSNIFHHQSVKWIIQHNNNNNHIWLDCHQPSSFQCYSFVFIRTLIVNVWVLFNSLSHFNCANCSNLKRLLFWFSVFFLATGFWMQMSCCSKLTLALIIIALKCVCLRVLTFSSSEEDLQHAWPVSYTHSLTLIHTSHSFIHSFVCCFRWSFY